MDFLYDAVVVGGNNEAAYEQPIDSFKIEVCCKDGIETHFLVPKANLMSYSDLEAEVVMNEQELCFYDLIFYYLDRNGVYKEIVDSVDFESFLETRVDDNIYVIEMETLNWGNSESSIASMTLGASTASNLSAKLKSSSELDSPSNSPTRLDPTKDVDPSAEMGMSSAPKPESSTQSDLPETLESSKGLKDVDCCDRTNFFKSFDSSTISVPFENLDATIESDFWTSDLDCSTSIDSTTNLDDSTTSDSSATWGSFSMLDFLLSVAFILIFVIMNLTKLPDQESNSEGADPHSDKWTAFKETAQKYCNNHPSTSSVCQDLIFKFFSFISSDSVAESSK